MTLSMHLQVDDDLAGSSFGGNDTFESLIEKYTDAATNDTESAAKGMNHVERSGSLASSRKCRLKLVRLGRIKMKSE